MVCSLGFDLSEKARKREAWCPGREHYLQIMVKLQMTTNKANGHLYFTICVKSPTVLNYIHNTKAALTLVYFPQSG